MQYNCDIIANNNTDFVIANNITSGTVPLLLGAGEKSFVSDINFDIEEFCKNNASFRVKLKKTEEALKTSLSLQEKFEIMQNFINEAMPLCNPKKISHRDTCIFDGEPFSYLVENQMSMCFERATMAQYLCQKSGIKSYLTNSYVHIKNGEQGQHAYVIFEDNNQMFVYDPANPTKNNAPRIMSTNMDKTIFTDFIEAVNYNADCNDKKQKNCVGFVCRHEDGKTFLYRSYCGTKENTIGPKKLKEARLEKAVAAKIQSQLTDKSKPI